MNNAELFRLKTGARNIPVAQSLLPRPSQLPPAPDLPDFPRELIDPSELERFDPGFRIPGPIKFCGLKEGCWELVYSPKQFAAPSASLFKTRYKGTMRVERNGFDHTISGDLYRFLEYAFPLERLQIPLRVTRKWQNDVFGVRPFNRRPFIRRKCPIYARNKYHSYLECKEISYQAATFQSQCRFTLEFDQWNYTHPASGFDGDFAASPDRSVRMEIAEVSDTHFTGKLFEGAIELGSVSLQWRSKYFRTAHLEIFTLEGAEHPPASVPDGSGGSESFETIFETAGWQLVVERNEDKIPLPASLAGTDINQCWALPDLHEVMTSTPGYNNAELDSKWRVFLISVPARLGCSRGVVFDQGAGDTNALDREGSATFSHDGFNNSSNYGAVEGELMKDWPRGFLRSAAHEVGHAFNQYHQPTQNSIMCPTPSVAAALASSGETFPDDISLAFNETVRHRLIHLPDPAVRPGAMDWATAFNVPSADDINFYDSEDLQLKVKVSKSRVCIGEPVDIAWSLENHTDVALTVAGAIDGDQHSTRISVTKPNGDIVPVRLPLDAHDDSHELVSLPAGKSIAAKANLFWSRKGFAFDQPGKHVVTITVIWEDNGIQFAAQGEDELWVNYPVTERDNDIAASMLQEDVGRLLLTGNIRQNPEGLKRIESVMAKHEKHEVSEVLARRLKQMK
jgi:hypothetical protein